MIHWIVGHKFWSLMAAWLLVGFCLGATGTANPTVFGEVAGVALAFWVIYRVTHRPSNKEDSNGGR